MANGVVFIDARVQNFQALVNGADPSQVTVVLETSRDGIDQIADFLAVKGLTDLDAISIVGHGFAGGLLLGSTSLDEAGLESLAKPLTQIGGALGEDGDILLYACDVGQSEAGTRFIFDLSQLTGANVAAASHPVGNVSHGGSWDLDVRTGSIQAGNPFSAETLAGFQGVLAAPVTISPKPEGDRQYLPRLTGLGDGYSVVGWNDFSYTSFEVDTKFRIVGADGTPIGPAITIPDGGFDESIGGILSMGATANGFKFAVIYESWTNLGVPSILGKFYEFNTTTLAVTAGANFVVSNNPASDNTYPVATMVDANHFAVAWAYDGDAYSGGSFDTGMVIRLFDTNGNATSAITPIRTTADGISVSRWGSISSNGTNVTVQWEEGVGHIFLNNITTNGNGTIVGPVPAPVEVNIAGAELWSSIVMPSGEIMQLYSANGGDDLFFRLVSGTAPFSQTRAPQQVNSTDTDFGTHSAAAVVLPSGGFVIAWIRADDANDVKLYARIFDENFVARTNDILVPNDTAFDQIFTPNIQRGPDGGVYIVWSYDGTNEPHPSGTPSSAFDNPDIVGRLFVNIGPTATGTAETLASFAEDTTNPAGTVLSSFLTDQFDDLDNHPLAGVAVRGNAATGGQGTWQFSTNGTSWTNIATNVSDSNATILAPTDLVRFVPVANFNGNVPALSVRLWDGQGAFSTGTTGINITGAIFDSNPNGGTLENPFTGNTIAIGQFVTGVNDAPSATGGANLGNINEDTANPAGQTVTSFVTGSFSDALDNQTANGGTSANTLAGIAIVGNSAAGQGTWQYSSDGTSWSDVGTPSFTNALIVQSSHFLRFVPAANFNGPAPTLTAHVIDNSGSSGVLTTGTTRNLTGATGGITAISSNTLTVGETISAVNDAPTVAGDGTETLGAVNEDASAPGGATVSTLFSGQFSDALDNQNAFAGGSSPNAFAGIAIVNNAETTQGSWQWLNGGVWTDIASGNIAATALLLAGSTQLRFLPAANFNGAVPALTVRLVDDSGGALTSGNTVNLSVGGSTGGTTRYSAATATVDTSINAVNDAPNVINGAAVTLTPAINEDNFAPAGQTINALFLSHFSDADDTVGVPSVDGFSGVAITANAATAAQGVWQYFTGGVWTDLPAVTAGTAFLIAAADSLRFVPALNFNGPAPLLTVHLVEDVNGGSAVVTGGTADLTTTGDPTRFSAALTLGQIVNAVNDDPTLAGLDPATFNENTVNAGAQVIDSTVAFDDIDSPDLNGGTLTVTYTAGGMTEDQLAVLNAGGITVTAGTTVNFSGNPIGTITTNGVNGANLVVTFNTVNATPAAVDALIQALGYANTSDTPAPTRTIGITVTDGDGGSTPQMTSLITVNAENDPPTLTGLNAATFAENTVNLAPQIIDSAVVLADVDSPDLNGGNLTVTYSAAGLGEDQLSIRNVGTGAGEISVSGTTVSYQNVAIGTITSAGVNGANLVATFSSAAATPEAVDALIEALQYANTSHTPTLTRTVSITVNDGDAGTSTASTVLVTVNAENDAPVLSDVAAGVTYPGGGAVTLDGALMIADVDNASLASATVTITDFFAGDVLLVNGAQNSGAPVNGISWTYNGAGVLSFIGAGLLADYEALLEQVQYDSTAPDPIVGGNTRSVSWVINDGAVNNVTPPTTTIQLNNAPTLPADTDPAADAVTEGAGAGVLVGIDVNSTDPEMTTVTYSFAPAGDAGGRFAIDSTTGIVSVSATGATAIDFEGSGGSYAITVRATDSDGVFSDAGFTVTVNNVAPPQPSDGNGGANTVVEGVPSGTPVGITASSLDVNGGPVTYAITAGNADGAFAIDLNSGIVTVNDATKLNFEAVTSRTLTVQANDGTSSSPTQDFTIAITNAAPPAPVDNDGGANTVPEDTANGATVGVTASATDVNGGTVTYAITAGNADGAFAIDVNSGIITVNDATKLNFEATPTRTLTVQASDGTNAGATQDFIIGVTNVAPVASGDSYSVSEDGTLLVAAPGTLGNDGDVNGGGITAVLDAGPANAASFVLNADGSFSYTPNADFFGTDSFTYRASDGLLSSAPPVTVTIAVNGVADTPSVTNASTNEDTQNGSGLVITRNAADGPEVTHFQITGVANGTLFQNDGVTAINDGDFITVAQGNAGLKFSPAANFNGAGAFNAQAAVGNSAAGLGSAVTSATINVAAVNDAPVASIAPANYAFSNVSGLSLKNNGLSVADVDGGGGLETLTLSVGEGTLSVTAGGSGAGVSGSGTAAVTITGTLAQINALLNTDATSSLGYNAAASPGASTTLTAALNDNGNTGSGGPLASSDSATINLTQVFTGTPGDDAFNVGGGNQNYFGLGGTDTLTFNFRLVDAVVSYVGNKVIIDSASSHTEVNGFEVFAFTDGTVNNADGDVLVDDLFYYSQYHDVWNAGVSADTHYHQFGWREARDPDAFFSTSTYLSANPDVSAFPVDPLIHYDAFGWQQGRIPSIDFDGNKYLQANPDVAAAAVDPLAHFLRFGAQEGRQPIPPGELLQTNGFDYVFYLNNNPDVAAARVDPFAHFQNFGWREGRDPSTLFDTSGYLATYTDVAAANTNPLDHFHQFGWREGRDPSTGFDTTSYLAIYPDVAAAHIDPLKHFLQFGIHEGRSPQGDGLWG